MMELSSKFADHDDFFVEEELIDQTTIYLMGFKTLIDFAKSNLYIRQMAASSASVGELLQTLVINLIWILNKLSMLFWRGN